jgi:hypothetical protein
MQRRGVDWVLNSSIRVLMQADEGNRLIRGVNHRGKGLTNKMNKNNLL